MIEVGRFARLDRGELRTIINGFPRGPAKPAQPALDCARFVGSFEIAEDPKPNALWSTGVKLSIEIMT